MNVPLTPVPANPSFDSYAPRYSIDYSKVTLREFMNLSGRPLQGLVFWLMLRAGLTTFAKQIISGPRPFSSDQRTVEEIGETVRGELLAKAAAAEKLGFHSRFYYAERTSGIEVEGGAVRMLHGSGQLFLQILAAGRNGVLQSYSILVSAKKDFETVFVTSSGPPSFRPQPGFKATRKVGAPLDELLRLHQQSIAGEQRNLLPVGTRDEMGAILDHMAHQFFADKIARGIYTPVPS